MCCCEELPFSGNIPIAVDDEQDAILPIFVRHRQFAGIGVAGLRKGGMRSILLEISLSSHSIISPALREVVGVSVSG